jgi:hypothetical protein
MRSGKKKAQSPFVLLIKMQVHCQKKYVNKNKGLKYFSFSMNRKYDHYGPAILNRPDDILVRFENYNLIQPNDFVVIKAIFFSFAQPSFMIEYGHEKP